MVDLAESTDVQDVILVHGTFATSREDVGRAWWQVGSQPYKALQQKLPPRVKLNAEGRLFRWSGENNERARSKAAARLLEFLKPYEQSGKKYHLVGHSHGGSVIWSALRQATVKRQTLDNLRSWSTVGTPFLHHQSRSPWSAMSILYMLLAAIFIFPALKAFWFIVRLPYDLLIGNLDGGVVIALEDEVNVVNGILRAPFLKGLELLRVPLTETSEGLRIGSFGPESETSSAFFLLCSIEGWIILAAIMFFAYLTILLFSYCVGPVMEVVRNAREKKLEETTFNTYGSRWLGVWTKDDEAINGLRKTLELSLSFITKLVPRERVFISDVVSLPSRPLFWVGAPIFNRWVRPLLDATIRNIVVKTAQGNNRPAVEIVAVSPHPLYEQPEQYAPPLPQWLSEKILRDADLHASELGPKLRALIGEPSLSAGLEKFSEALAGQELVHTSYFDHPEVIELLALNIGCSQGKNRLRRASTNSELAAWFEAVKAQQAAQLSNDEPQSNEPQSNEPSGIVEAPRQAA